MLSRNRTIASTCGISIDFKKGELHLVPPAMYAEVLAAGGVPEDEIPEDEMPPAAPTPEQLLDREAAMMKAFKAIVLRNDRNDFTAGGTPHASVLSRDLGWSVQAKERDAAWVKFTAANADVDD
jgi:hypothetical protein